MFRDVLDYHHVVFHHVPGTRTKHQHWALRYMWNICWDTLILVNGCICFMLLQTSASQNDNHNITVARINTEYGIQLLLGSWFRTAFSTLWIPLIWLWYVGQFPSSKSTWAKSPEDSIRISVILNICGTIMIIRAWVYTIVQNDMLKK